MEKLSEKCTQPPLFEFEWYTVRPFDGWHLWIERNGEGMTIRKAEFIAVLEKFFEKF